MRAEALLVICILIISGCIAEEEEETKVFIPDLSKLTKSQNKSLDIVPPVISNRPVGINITVPTSVDISSLEIQTHLLINYEREKRGLDPLIWNEEIAQSARRHSLDMANGEYFDHKNPRGEYHYDRLFRDRVYYFSASGENLHRGSNIQYYVKNLFNVTLQTGYWTQEEMAINAVEGWMNSSGHRKNILSEEYDETGIGIESLGSDFYFTQVFIKRAFCGFETGPCCVETGYYPYCFVELECDGSICIKP